MGANLFEKTMPRTLLVIACLLLMTPLASPVHAAGALPVRDKTIVWEKGHSKMNVHYPRTGNAVIDKTLKDYALHASVNPNANVNPLSVRDYANDNANYSLYLGYKMTRNDGRFLGVSFEGDEYMGGAHGLPLGRTFLFLLPEGKTLNLADLIDGERGMQKISQIARAGIFDHYKTVGEKLDEDRIGEVNLATRPDALGFSDFTPKADALVLNFGPYVFGGRNDALDISIPLTDLKDVMRADPSIPQPSFSCEQAKTRIEKAICSDTGLASADREVANRYGFGIAVNRELNTSPENMVELQRAWLAQRNKDCASGNLTCLHSSYAKRLKGLFL
jgi:uncharacterized protein YecT (DUF1311 family)